MTWNEKQLVGLLSIPSCFWWQNANTQNYKGAISRGISAGEKVQYLCAKSYCRVSLRLWNGSVTCFKSLFIGAFSWEV